MNLFSRIAIGTANFGSEYNGVKVPEKDIEKILGYCQCSGIDTLDCAVAYGWDWQLANSYFKKIVKVRKGDDIDKVIETEPYCVMAHDKEVYSTLWRKNLYMQPRLGISIYDKTDYYGTAAQVIQCPYSLYDRRFEDEIREMKDYKKASVGDIPEIHVRSIFLRGRILEDGIDPQEAIKFCLCNPHIDKVIIGVDSFEQLQRNLDFLHRWKNLERHDEDLLDTRRW